MQQKRVKAVEAESKLKQVYIPNYTKQSPALITNNKSILNGTSNGNGDITSLGSGKSCESCSTTSSQAVSFVNDEEFVKFRKVVRTCIFLKSNDGTRLSISSCEYFVLASFDLVHLNV